MGRSHVFAAAALLVLGAGSSQGQVIRPERMMSTPFLWTSVSAGWVRMPRAVHDGPSNAWWNFGDGSQLRGSVEYPISRTTSLGGAFTTSNVGLVWSGTDCGNSANLCNANANIAQYLGVLHYGGTRTGFNEALDVEAGITRFSDFQTDTGSSLGTGKPTTDFTFAVAYGFGYSVASWLQVTLQQEFLMMAHKKTAGAVGSTVQSQTTRIGVRVGL